MPALRRGRVGERTGQPLLDSQNDLASIAEPWEVVNRNIAVGGKSKKICKSRSAWAAGAGRGWCGSKPVLVWRPVARFRFFAGGRVRRDGGGRTLWKLACGDRACERELGGEVSPNENANLASGFKGRLAEPGLGPGKRVAEPGA
jgi:hypothetical protein